MLSSVIRRAFRLFRRSPGFAAVAVLSLATGLGVSTAALALVEGERHGPDVAIADVDRIFQFDLRNPNRSTPVPAAAQMEALRLIPGVAAVTAYRSENRTVEANGQDHAFVHRPRRRRFLHPARREADTGPAAVSGRNRERVRGHSQLEILAQQLRRTRLPRRRDRAHRGSSLSCGRRHATRPRERAGVRRRASAAELSPFRDRERRPDRQAARRRGHQEARAGV